jgi:hypothetical protein
MMDLVRVRGSRPIAKSGRRNRRHFERRNSLSARSVQTSRRLRADIVQGKVGVDPAQPSHAQQPPRAGRVAAGPELRDASPGLEDGAEIGRVVKCLEQLGFRTGADSLTHGDRT